MSKVTVNRRAYFNLGHRLCQKNWSDKKNYEVFGKCSKPNYYGHNYELIVSLTGKIDKETGFVYDLGELRSLIKSEIEEPFDHKNLNLDVEEFKNLNLIAENISVVIYNKLRKITLYGTPRNFITYSG